jgi:hypothetical protein
MASDPDPDDIFSVADAYSAIRTGYANRPEARVGDETLKAQARMSGILFE